MPTDQPTESAYPAIIETRLSTIAALCRRFGVRRLDLFGSAATGHFDLERSDLDFLVEFEPNHPCGYADAYFGLHEKLEILFGRPIDLLTASALKNPYLRRRILEERRTVFQAP